MVGILTLISLFGAVICYGAYLLLRFRHQIRRFSDAFIRLPPLQKVVLVTAIGIATVSAQKPTTNLVGDVERRGVSSRPKRVLGSASVVQEVGTWHLTGAYDGVTKVDLSESGFRFPFENRLYDTLWAFTWGKIRPQIRNATNEIVAVGTPMSAIPGVSRLLKETRTNSVVITWQDFTVGRVKTNALESAEYITAQIELFDNGDYITRSNEVERAFRYVNVDDWDDDGIANEEDTEPFMQAIETQFGPHQDLTVVSNQNAYCWVDVVVRHANAKVIFSGDGVSNLADASFIAKAGEVYRVTLLIGKSYVVTSAMPIEIVGQSSDEISVSRESESSIRILWPVTFEAEMRESRMARTVGEQRDFMMRVSPMSLSLAGDFVWTSSCCPILGSGLLFSMRCRPNCDCMGCTIEGRYDYEGYTLPVQGIFCGCHLEDNDNETSDREEDTETNRASVSVKFSKNAIIFEDAYESSEDVTVPRRSTESTLTCFAYGGPSGGVATFEVVGNSRLETISGRSLPFTQRIEPNQDYEVEIVYQGKKGFGTQVQVTASFVSNNPDEHVDDSTANLNVVEVEIMCQVQAPENASYYRHKFGVGEKINCNHYPAVADFRWSSMTVNGVSNEGEYQCPLLIASNPLMAICGDATFTPNIQVVKPTGIEVRKPKCVTYDIPAGRAGWVGLRQEFYVTPLDVSFSNIAMEEVSSTVGHRDGYFGNPAFYVIDCHSFALGAGRWLKVDDDNLMGIDTARLTLELLRVDDDGNFTDNTAYHWRTGWITWEIPFAWASGEIVNPDSTARLIEQFDPHAGARFDISPNGDVTVTKFSNAAKREINATFKLNGEICIPVH